MPFLRYGNLRGAISWLGTTLGFSAPVTVGDSADERDSGRGYSCRDPEDDIWRHQPVRDRPQRGSAMIAALSLSLSLLMIGSTVALSYLHVVTRDAAERNAASEQALRTSIEQEVREELLHARRAREAVELANEEIRAQLARLQHEIEAAREVAAKERGLRLATERKHANAVALLAVSTRQKELTEIAARQARDLAAKERRLRLAAERSSKKAAQRRTRVSREAKQRALLARPGSHFTSSW